MKLSFKPKELTANQKAGGCAAQGIMWAVITLGAIFADVMFIALIRDALPGGIMGAGAIAGAFVTSLSIVGLVMGKTHWFRPGEQIWAAWIFTGIEIIVAILNVITAIQFARHQDLGFLSYWLAYGAPCTPFVPMIGWTVIAFLSPDRTQRHAEMEMEDKMHKAELDYRKAAHDAQMEVMTNQLEQFVGFLQDFTTSPENMENSRKAAERMGRQTLGNITGMNVSSPGTSFIFQQQPPALSAPQSLNQQAVTGEFRALPAIENPEKMLELINTAVQAGMMTEEEARPLRQALKAGATPQSKNGHQ